MSLIALNLPPGMYRQGTDYQAKARWLHAQYMRWYQKTMRPVGGWVTAPSNGDLDGPGRGLVAWRLLNNSRAAAIGTPNKLWYFDDDQLYDITPTTLAAGNVDTIYGVGYGFNYYGGSAYSTSPSGGSSDATTWSLDNYGQLLVACASHDGTVYLWQLDPTIKPTLFSVNAPTGRAVFVTPERFVVVLGANGDPRQLAWPDLTDINAWTASQTNQAGNFELQTTGAILAGVRVRGQSLILTTVDAWTMTYVQPPSVYSFQQAGYDCGLIGGNAAVPFLGGAAWMSYNGFFTFNGGVVYPVVGCEVADEVFRDLDRLQQAKCSGGHNSLFGELTWQFPSLSTGAMRAVTWNYRENHWALDGQPSRSCWTDRGVFDYPLATSTAGRLYRQEYGWLADGVSRIGQVFAESGPVEIDTGDNVVSIIQCLPDEMVAGQWSLLLGTRFTPEGTQYSYGPFPLLPKTNMRVTGRQIGIKLQNTADVDARIGQFRFDGRVGGLR